MIIDLEDLEFINDTIKELIERKHISSRTNTYIFEKQHLEWARGIAEHYQDFYLRNNQTWKGGKTDFENTKAGMYLKQDHPKEYKKIVDGKAFIISSWGALFLLACCSPWHTYRNRLAVPNKNFHS